MKISKAAVFALFLTVSAIFAAFPSAAEEPDYGVSFKNGVYEGEISLPYRVYVPDGWESSEYPLILSLHGAGYRGADNSLQITDGLPYYFIGEGMGAEAGYKAIVVAPQCPEDMQWVDVPWENGSYSVAKIPESSALKTAFALIMSLCKTYNADMGRLYLTGLSMGGYGVWDMLARHPGVFAAAVPICGGGDPSTAPLMTDVAIRDFHGDSDLVVPYKASKDMSDALKAAGAAGASLTTYKGGGHNAWSRTYSEPSLYDWLFAQKRAVVSATVEETAEGSSQTGLPASDAEVSDTAGGAVAAVSPVVSQAAVPIAQNFAAGRLSDGERQTLIIKALIIIASASVLFITVYIVTVGIRERKKNK